MIALQRVEFHQKSTLRNLIELYKYDFSEFDPEDVNESGLYEYKYLDHYWTEDGRYPFFIRVDGALAGFVLVRKLEDMDELPVFWMAEFFVMKKYQHQGVGEKAANEIFNQFQGVWRVAQIEANAPAQHFWRKIIGRYTNSDYREIREEDWDGPIQTFISVSG